MIYGLVSNHGDDVEIEWGEDATEWHKKAVEEYGATTAKEVEEAFEWREAMDDLETDHPQVARAIRGKHPTENRDIPRPKPYRDLPNNQQ
ncbi:hypothetical protein C457_10481 [Haloferax prahovense DSM 18310]|uniref:Uncharacterized protein n=1 Tax=Haloferax prahovense (strain DSM 18310 / JCM 13924 / TL6) TaxID=1227461 RepID=M0GDD7_HALPT|nr:hypothetical protein [Haloferax prahovense]ELZ68834.1 hypothetical protein C457_10481 [Haloferax prahovense DSM 18310]